MKWILYIWLAAPYHLPLSHTSTIGNSITSEFQEFHSERDCRAFLKMIKDTVKAQKKGVIAEGVCGKNWAWDIDDPGKKTGIIRE